MYWRLTSKEKPIKKGKIKVIAAWQADKIENIDHMACYYDGDNDKWCSPAYKLCRPTHWSYIDELPSEDNEPTEE